MVVIGLDFGSHTASIALYYEEKDVVDVIADDLGSRAIPIAVAYRGTEVITGQAAIQQQHKNNSNTFDDVRGLLFNIDSSSVFVPALDKEISVTELASHFFRNIHNQIKQQVGKVIRDTVISLPQGVSDAIKSRIIEAAQAGGIRIKYFIEDTTSTLLAYQLHSPSNNPSMALVIDIGWSASQIALYSISGGVMTKLSCHSSEQASGKVFVSLLADHCAKEFLKKAKFPCSDNSRSMLRLRRECEAAVKAMSVGAEATIDIDSLCEGVDFSCKISRARFEDMCGSGFAHLKSSIGTTLTSASAQPSDVSHVCISGGLSLVPKVTAIIKSIVPEAIFPKVRLEPSEAQCVGAAVHASDLFTLGLLDNAPTSSPTLPCLSKAILISDAIGPGSIAIPSGSILPCVFNIQATVVSGVPSLLRISTGTPEHAVPHGDIVFTTAEGITTVNICVSAATDGQISAKITAEGDAAVLGELTVPHGK